MRNDVTIVRDGVICTGAAKSMYDEAGDEVLMVKVLKKKNAATNKLSAEASQNETKFIKRGVMMTATVETGNRARVRRPVICENTGMEFKSLSAAARYFFPHRRCEAVASQISRCCRNKKESINGMKFRYLQ